MEVILRGGKVLHFDDTWTVTDGDIAAVDGIITHIGPNYIPTTNDYEVIDVTDHVVMPGLIQSHVHTCQTLARGRADDLQLLDWLKQVIWPYEAALTHDELGHAAELAMAELLLGGTTAILDMATVHHTDAVFDAADRSGIRATIGKAIMDVAEPDVPKPLQDTTKNAIDESIALCNRWHGQAHGRLRYAFSPRFALSCTEDALRAASAHARELGVHMHTHTSENTDEIAEVERRTGRRNLEYLESVGMTGSDVGLAHCVWLNDAEKRILKASGSHVLHCPSSNLKLASGIAEIPDLLARGISVSLGADGAPCNNNLDGFVEMRLASLLQKPTHGAQAMKATTSLRLATRGGANALGLGAEIGSLELGKRADLIALDLRDVHCLPHSDIYAALVYAARSTDVRHVIVDGHIVVRDRQLLTVDIERLRGTTNEVSRGIFARL